MEHRKAVRRSMYAKPPCGQLAISQSPESSRANPMLEGQEIWQHTFKLNV